MASKVKTGRIDLRTDFSVYQDETIESYCSDCLYDWCASKDKVTFCTQKSKGLFECKSCLSKLMKQ